MSSPVAQLVSTSNGVQTEDSDASYMGRRSRRRGPNPSRAKEKRDKERLERHLQAMKATETTAEVAVVSAEVRHEVRLDLSEFQPAGDDCMPQCTHDASELNIEDKCVVLGEASGIQEDVEVVPESACTDLSDIQLGGDGCVSGCHQDGLEPIIEEGRLRAASNEQQDVHKMRKQAERIRCGSVLRESTPISGNTQTEHAHGNAVKADALTVQVGGKHLLEDAKLLISGDQGTYGLVGPNGCGKTTLLRLVSGDCQSDVHIPLPRQWGKPKIIDQLDPEPTGRSPLDEVLSSHEERSRLLEDQAACTKQLEKFKDTELSQEDAELMNSIIEKMDDIDGQLLHFHADEQKVISILGGLGFHNGEQSVDGAPSLRIKDELVTAENAKEGQDVEVRDPDDEEWLRGTVTSVDPLKVRPKGWMESFTWSKVRHRNELSGGWRKKIQLAKALYEQPRLLLLDEPTNHLDLHALLYLEDVLKKYKKPEKGQPARKHPTTVLIVSHNASFLKEVCDQALQIQDRKIVTKPMKDLSLSGLAAIQSDSKVKQEEWQFAYPSAHLADPEMHGLSFHDVAFRYHSKATPVFHNINNLKFSGKSRSVLIGRNGSGKSTLLKLCLGLENPTAGEVNSATCKVRHFSQHFHEELERHPTSELSAVSFLVRDCADSLKKRCRGDEDKMRDCAGAVLKRFGLAREQAWNMRVADLSGGQKARVNFAFLSLCPAHLLILDEPTNHLDASGLDHLTDAIKDFKGGILLISHDESLIQQVLSSSETSTLLVCRDGSIHRQSDQQSGMQCFNAYRRDALHEQYERAKAAALKGIRGKITSSVASTREPSPEETVAKVTARPGCKNKAMTLNGLQTKWKKDKAKKKEEGTSGVP